MILDDHKNEIGQPKLSGNRKEKNTGNTNDNHKYQFETPRKLSKMKKVDTNIDFYLNENYPIDNNSDSNKENEKHSPAEIQKEELLPQLF